MKRNRHALALLFASLIVFGSAARPCAADTEKVAIYRDEFGVPHILAESNRGVFYGAGYAIAQDRLNQIHRLRLLAEGRLAEVAGADYLASDCQVRRNLGGLAAAEKAASRVGPPYRDWLEAYSEGINHAIRDLALNGMIEPWTPADTVAIQRYLVWEFSQGRSAELERLATLNYLRDKFDEETARAMWADLMSPIDPDAITTVPGSKEKREEKTTASGDGLLEGVHGWPATKFPGTPPRLGSNAIVAAPGRSATGNPLLVSNTQLEIHFPAVYYEQHLKGGDFDVVGFTMPGFPPVGFGHNATMAWTITVGCSDQQDVYEETVRVGPKKWPQYLFKGEWLDCAHRKEIIPVKGYPEPVELSVFSTVHGPLEMADFEKGWAYATRWGPYTDGHTLMAFFDMNRAKTMDDFSRALEKVQMSFNFLYADVDGNIAYWHAGELPRRAPGHSGVMPVSGNGDYEWRGFVPFEQLPRFINPAENIILLENNMPAPDSPPYDGSLTNWGTQRIRRLTQLCDELPEKIAMDDLERVLEDTRYLVADTLKPELLRVCRARKGERFREAGEYLERWDNAIRSDSVGATIFFVWLQKLGRETLTDEFGEHCIASLVEKPHLPLILHAFEGEASTLPPSRDYFDNIATTRRETKDDIIAVSLSKTLDLCEQYFGTPDMARWQWGGFSYWPVGPLPSVPNLYMDPNRHHTDVIGGGASVQLIEAKPGFADARNVMPPGNSGDARSPHSGDQIELFLDFEYKPMPFDAERIKEEAVSKKTLEIERNTQ